jgi:ATP-dependent Zn protease
MEDAIRKKYPREKLKRFELVHTYPMNSSCFAMTHLYHMSGASYNVYSKGAPETILKQCKIELAVQQTILDQNQLAVVVHGAPGTGKTAWTQSVAKEILVPLGYVIFILDHDAITNFVPPTYLEKICIIINEADNLAQDRASEVAQYNNKTEHILALLDGTLYQSIIDESGIQMQQKLVILMTCNTTERLDPAMLRKGRVDLICEFTKKFV